MNIEQMFEGMAGADLNGKGNYMGEGQYLVESRIIKVKDGYRGKSFIFEFEILETSNEEHPVGSRGSYVVKLDKKQAFGDVKALFFALAMGRDPNTVKSPKQDPATHEEVTELVKAALDSNYAKKAGYAEDEFIGLQVRLETHKVKTQKGGDFTVHNWRPVNAEQSEAPLATAA